MPDTIQLAGTLSTMSLADLLQWVCLGFKTGTLHLESGRVKKQIHVDTGKLVSATSNLPRERLGQLLLHHGRINEEQLQTALARHEACKKPLGEVLCDMGLLDEESLVAILEMKVEETIYDLFLWSEGNFHFVAEEPHWPVTPVSLDATGLIMEGVRRADEMGLIRMTLPTNRARLAVSDDHAEAAERLTGFDRHLVDQVRQGTTIAEVVRHSRANEFTLLRRLHEFLEQGLLVVLEEGSGEDPDAFSFEEGLDRCREQLDESDLSGALHDLSRLKGLAAHEPEGSSALAELQDRAIALIYETAIKPNQIPVLRLRFDELATLDLTAEEGFVVSRIDGTMDVRSVIQVSPVGEFETLAIFRRLLEQDVIDITDDGRIEPRRT